MVHCAICLNLSNLTRPAKNFSVFLDDCFILAIGGQYDVRNRDLFSVLLSETSMAM